MNELMNKGESIPKEFFVFVNELRPITQHNLKITKQFSSGSVPLCQNEQYLEKYIKGNLKYLPFDFCENDATIISPYLATTINNYKVEYDAETCRFHNFKIFPSKLSAIYAFGDYESCITASKKYNWDLKSVKKFELIDWPLTRIVKVNMEIISLVRFAYNISSVQDIDLIWKNYWTGGGNIDMELPTADFKRKKYHSEIIWEYLIEGIIKLKEDE